VWVRCGQLQARLSRVQKLAAGGDATDDSRDSFHGSGDISAAEADGEQSHHQVGPTSHMSLLDQHSKLKLEALGNLLIIRRETGFISCGSQRLVMR